MNITFKIKRYNKEKPDQKAYFDEFQLELPESATVLDGLMKIKEEKDGSLSFRRACRAAICGSCAVTVNGRAKLACKTQVKTEWDKYGVLKIEPLKSLPVIKDLVVAMDGFFEKMYRIKPWLIPESKAGDKERKMSPERFNKLYKSATCILCGCCFSSCPVYEVDKKFLGPAASVKSYRFSADSREGTKKERLKELQKEGIWYCSHCESCVAQCPKEIMPQELINLLREMSVKEGFVKNDGARHALAFKKSIKRTGELDEARLPLYTFGLFRVIKQVPLAIKLFFKGKLPPVIMKKIKDINNLKKLFKNGSRE